MSTGIVWADETWNPLLGCTKVSPGCDGCYAVTTSRIRENNPNPKISAAFAGLVRRDDAGNLDWTEQINLLPARLDQPLRWKRPRRIFVNSQSDLFHDSVPDEFIAKVWTIMAAAPQHTFQILTKRHARMRSVVRRIGWRSPTTEERAQGVRGPQAYVQVDEKLNDHLGAPRVLPNVWLGVSVENQKWANIRIPVLLDTPAAVRWISLEPMLGPVDLSGSGTRLKYWLTGQPTWGPEEPTGPGGIPMSDLIIKPALDWVVVGGESGHGARPMHPAWARTIRDQCTAAGVPFLFKQWGEWGPAEWKVDRIDGETDDAFKARAEATGATHAHTHTTYEKDGKTVWHLYEPNHKPWSLERGHLSAQDWNAPIRRWGRKNAGCLLDGREWNQYPEPVTV